MFSLNVVIFARLIFYKESLLVVLMVERTPIDQEVVGSNTTQCRLFFSSLSFFLFLSLSLTSVSLRCSVCTSRKCNPTVFQTSGKCHLAPNSSFQRQRDKILHSSLSMPSYEAAFQRKDQLRDPAKNQSMGPHQLQMVILVLDVSLLYFTILNAQKIIYENEKFFIRDQYYPLTVCLQLMEPYSSSFLYNEKAPLRTFSFNLSFVAKAIGVHFLHKIFHQQTTV